MTESQAIPMLFVPLFLVITSLRKTIWSGEVQNCLFLYGRGFITPFSTHLLSLWLRCCFHSLHFLVSDTPGKGHQRAGLCGPASPLPGTHRAAELTILPAAGDLYM